MGAIKTFCITMAAALSFVLSVPLHAAEVKVLDDLDKTIHADAIKDRCSRYQQASLALQKSLDELNTDEEISSIFRINKVLAQVAQSEKMMARTSEELAELNGYLTVNKEKLVTNGLEMFLPLAKLNDVGYKGYEEALKAYLAAFNDMLEYSKSNMPALRVGRKAEMDAYDNLYSRYVAATDRQGEAYTRWSQFLLDFFQEYPLLRPYLEQKPKKEEMS